MSGRGLAVLGLCAVAACGGGGSGGPPRRSTIAWKRLRNPILGYPDRAAKDGALVFAGGRWHVLYSSLTADGRWRVGIVTSADLSRWSPPTSMPHGAGVEGEASPDVTRAPDGRWVVTYTSFPHDAAGGEAKLYFRTTRDFRRFSAARPLAHELHPGPGERMIDPAVARTPAGLLLAYKLGLPDGPQAFELARSTTGSLDGPWQLVGRPDIRVYGDTIENFQFLHLDRRWRLLATSNNLDRPFLFELGGSPHDPRGWLRWSPGRELQVPDETWNVGRGATGITYEHANSAFLVDRRSIDGYRYLLYAGSSERTEYGGQGHARLGLARSTDLVHWTVPPG